MNSAHMRFQLYQQHKSHFTRSGSPNGQYGQICWDDMTSQILITLSQSLLLTEEKINKNQSWWYCFFNTEYICFCIIYCILIHPEDFWCKKNLQIVIKNSWQYMYAFKMTKQSSYWNIFNDCPVQLLDKKPLYIFLRSLCFSVLLSGTSETNNLHTDSYM